MVIRKEHDSRILGLQKTCAFVFVENAKLQVVLIKEMTTEQKRQTMFVGIDVHKDTHTAVGISPFGEKLFELTVGNYKKDFEALTNKVAEMKGTLSPYFGLARTVMGTANDCRHI